MSQESPTSPSARRWRRALAVACGVIAVPAAVAGAYAATGTGTPPSHHDVNVPAASSTNQGINHDAQPENVVAVPPAAAPSTTLPETRDAAPNEPTSPPEVAPPSEPVDVEPGENQAVEAPEAGDNEPGNAENENGNQSDGRDASSTPIDSQTETFTSAGGSITVTENNGVLSLDSTSPAAGFSVEVHDNGPDRVEVRFHSGDAEWRIRVEFENGAFTSEISQDG